MFIGISDIKKHFGEGESRVDVLKGISRHLLSTAESTSATSFRCTTSYLI